MAPSEPKPVYPLKAIEQNAVLYGLNGFSVLGLHGVGERALHDHFITINRHELHAEGVRKAVAFTRRYLADEAAHAISGYITRDAVKQLMCEMLLPEFRQSQLKDWGHDYRKARTLEELGYVSGSLDYKETLNDMFAHIRPERKNALLQQEKENMAAKVAHRATGVLGNSDPAAEQELAREITDYLGKLDCHMGIDMPHEEGFPAIEKLIKPMLLRHLQDIEHNAGRFADEARAYVEHPKPIADHIQFRCIPGCEKPERVKPGKEPPPPRGKRLWYTGWTVRGKAPPEKEGVGYERPLIDAAPPLAETPEILKRIDKVMMDNLTPQMRALILDFGLQVMMAGEKRRPDDYREGLYTGESHSNRWFKLLHFLHGNAGYGEGALFHTRDPKVMLEEIFHYACGHPVVGMENEEFSGRWKQAFDHDLGGLVEDFRTDAKQLAARELLKSHFTHRPQPSWKRNYFGHNESIAFEVSYEIMQCVRDGVPEAELREKLPQLYPMFQELTQRMQREGQNIMDSKPEIGCWAQESILPHVLPGGHMAQRDQPDAPEAVRAKR